MFACLAHQSSMQELDLLNPVLDPRIAFSRASSKTYFGSDGLLHTAAADEWPLEYDPITLQPLGRSVWEQRTNLLLYSHDLTNAYWNAATGGATITANAGIALDGTMTACRVAGSTSFAQIFSNAVVVTGGLRYALSAVITPEQAVGNWALRAYRDASNYAAVELNFSSATPTGVLTEAGTAAASTFSITRVAANSWLVVLLFTPSASLGWSGRFYVNYGTAAAKSAIVDCFQLEAGAFASPYIPTVGSQVTRVRDVPDLADIRTVRFNQARGQTVLLEYQYENGNSFTLMQVLDEDAALDNDWLIYSNNNPDNFIARMYGTSGTPGAHFGGVFTSSRGVPNKGVVATDQGGTSGTLNGAPVVSSSTCVPPSSGLLSARLAQLASGSSVLNGHLRRIRFYPAKLSPPEMLTLAA